jgi:hypothetical protein
MAQIEALRNSIAFVLRRGHSGLWPYANGTTKNSGANPFMQACLQTHVLNQPDKSRLGTEGIKQCIDLRVDHIRGTILVGFF